MRIDTLAVALLVVLLASAPATPAERLSPTVMRARGTPDACGDITGLGRGTRGGCEFDLVTGKVEITTLTMFGDEPLGNCPFRFRTRIGPEGELAIDRVRIDAYPLQDPLLPQACGDVMACQRDAATATEDRPGLPWFGRIVADESGGFEVVMRVCFDTCLGRFEGRTGLRLSQRPNGRWRLWSERAPVGTSGMELAGSWDLAPVDGGKLVLHGR